MFSNELNQKINGAINSIISILLIILEKLKEIMDENNFQKILMILILKEMNLTEGV